ncbi:MAG: restriction endonuclease, partial [Paracoccaceae bacterium]|nr:restriction endonuclease [Paracoccaceae bacterium]
REISHEERRSQSVTLEADKYVPEVEVRRRLAEKGWTPEWLLGWRDITNATNERTVISAIFPISASDDTLSLLLPIVGSPIDAALILAALNSLVLDYVAQQKVSGTHVRKYVISQLPILPPTYYTPERLAFLTPRVLELTYTSHALAPFARDLGYTGPPFAWDDARRAVLRAELDAFFARAYRLSRDDLRYILDPADVMGADYPSETFRVLKDKENRLYNEYRTQRLVLSAWDTMAEDGTFKAMGM